MEQAFQKLPAEKRRRVLDAALAEFSARDYKAANTDAIAARAGISKGALFYYFKNKKALYLTLVRHAAALVERELQLAPATPKTDLFDYLTELGGKKIEILKRQPRLVAFSVRVFYNGGAQVSPAVDRYMMTLTDRLFEKYIGRVDTSRFRPGCTPRQAIDLLMYLTDGYLHTCMMAGKPLDMDALAAQYRAWQDMVRRYVYKEEEDAHEA